ncbi:MAG: cytochrome c [Caulobacter sp.]|nr:cytochrome c [Caulobacter sp.]
MFRLQRPSALAATVLIVLSSGCAAAASGARPTPAPAQAQFIGVEAERGLALAQQRCVACHAIGPSGDSPAAMAPPFRALAQSLPGFALEDRLLVISDLGHKEMWPARLTPSEVRDLTAYIDSLD